MAHSNKTIQKKLLNSYKLFKIVLNIFNIINLHHTGIKQQSIPHLYHQGSRPYGIFVLFCAEWLLPPPDGVDTFSVHSLVSFGVVAKNPVI